MEHEGRCVGNRVNAYTSDMDFHGGSKLSKLTYPIKTIYSKEARVQLRKVLDDFKPDVCCGDYAYDAAEGKGDVIEEEYFENCEWHIRALFEGERKMEDNQAKCEGAGRSNVCVSYHALSEDWSEIADRTINMLEKIIENETGIVLIR